MTRLALLLIFGFSLSTAAAAPLSGDPRSADAGVMAALPGSPDSEAADAGALSPTDTAPDGGTGVPAAPEDATTPATDGGAVSAPEDGGATGLSATSPSATTSEGVRSLGQNTKLPKGFVGVIGRVTDGRSGEGLIEATVKVVAGGKKSALTDLDGFYRLKLPPGTYDLRVFYELYQGRRISNVQVRAGEPVVLDVALEADARSVQEVLVEAKVDKRNESALLQERKKAAVVSDAIGAQEIARTPDANAGEAVKRVVSATVVDGRYVYLRGLGGRYALTLLNGTLMPSPEPDEPSVPLDLFPSALVSDLNVLKTYSPDLPASFGGGTLVVDTSSFPTKLDARVKLTLGANTETTFRPRVTDPQAPLSEVFGLSDGSRALPEGFRQNGPAKVRDGDAGFTKADRVAQAKLLPNQWTPTTVAAAAPDVSVSGQVGDTLKLGGDKRLGYLLAAQWGRKEATRRVTSRTVAEVGDEVRAFDEFTSERGSLAGSTSVLGNVGLQLGRDHEVSLLGLMVNNAEAQATTLSGLVFEASQEQRSTRIDPVQRQLVFGQLRGFHRLGIFNDLEVSWQGNYARALRAQDDIRDFSQEDSGAGFAWAAKSGSGDRFFLSLVEESGGGTLDVTLPLAPRLKARAGGLAHLSARHFSGRRISFIQGNGLGLDTTRPAEELFAPAHLDVDDVRMQESTQGSDAYEANLLVFGGYALAEWNPRDWLRAQLGVRYEGTRLDLTAASPFSVESSRPDPVHKAFDDVVPSANLTFLPREDVNVRLAYAYTLARPTFRELGPFRFYDYLRRRDVTGNEHLDRTRIHHADARVEWFPGPTDVVAATVFFKKFERPIERLAATSGSSAGGGIFIFANTEAAYLAGAELEARASLGRLAPVLRELRVGANLALVYSRIVIGQMPGVNLTNSVRPLQGQSPYVVNAFLQWNHEATGTELGVFYNVYGPRISEVGTEGINDFYEQPFHQVDLVASQKLPGGFQLKATVANLLDGTRRITSDTQAGPVVAWSNKPGVQFQLALGWNLPNEDRSQR